MTTSVPKQTIVVSSDPGEQHSGGGSDAPGAAGPGSRKPPIGAIVGGVLGGVALLLLAGAAAFRICRRHGRIRERAEFDHFTYQYLLPSSRQDTTLLNANGYQDMAEVLPYPLPTRASHDPASSSPSTPSQALKSSMTDVSSPCTGAGEINDVREPMPSAENTDTRTQSSVPGEGMSSAESRSRPAAWSAEPGRPSPQNADGLWSEIQSLRRAVDQVRDAARWGSEPPPGYGEA